MSMISLQQTELFQYAQLGTTPVALHRKTETVLSSHKNVLTCHRQTDHGSWGVCGTWNVPPSDTLGIFAIEAYNSFMILQEKNKEIEAYFIDLSAKLIGKVSITNSIGGICADFDQKRKELLLFTKRGELKSYAVRFVTSSGRNGQSTSVFHVIYRIETRVPNALRSVPRQVICQHIPETVLGLTAEGCILCWETGSLDLLWHIEENRFIVPPSAIYADRFGSTFAVHCRGDGDVGPGRLEFWSPPATFMESNASSFERSCIPLKSHLLHLDVETIGGDFGTAVLLIQANATVQFWLFKDRALRQHCSLGLTGPSFGFSQAKFLGKPGFKAEAVELQLERPPAQTEEGGKDDASEAGGITVTSEAGALEAMTDSLIDLPPSAPEPPHRSPQGVVTVSTVGAFSSGSGLPGCEVLYLGFSEFEYCTLALHAPCEADKQWIDVVKTQRMLDDFHKTYDSDDGGDNDSGIYDAQGSPLLLSPGKAGDGSRTDANREEEEEEEDELDEPSYGGYDDSNNPVDAIRSEDGNVFYFTPSSRVPGLPSQTKDSVLQVVYPTGLVVRSEPSSDSKTTPEVKRICRNGLVPLVRAGDAIPAKSSLNFRHVDTACRSGIMMTVTELKEAFLFDLSNTSPHAKPIRLEIEIRPQASVTCLHIADVFIGLTPEQLLKDNLKACVEGSGITGTHVLSMVGDSDGLINFAVCSRSAVLQQGSIRAHSAPVTAIVSTGDSMRGLWKIGTKTKSSKGLQQLHPRPSPGSAVISLSRDGEMKVWQPMFSQSNNSRSSHAQILSIYQLSWRISGLGSVGSPSGGISPDISCASLDPTCVSCFVGYADGALAQWPVPGLTDRAGEKVQVVRNPIWFDKSHIALISCLKVWVHLPNTSIISAAINFKRVDPRGAKYACVVGDPVNASGTDETSVAYSLNDLRIRAESATFVVSSRDKTITLWRFMVSKNHESPEFADDLCRRVYPQCKYLTPIPCQSFNVSNYPDLSICYPITSSGRGTWRVSSLVGGIVVTIAQGSKGYLFTPKAKPEIEIDASLDSPISIRSASVGSLSDAATLISMLEGMCVVCCTHKPQKACHCAAKQGVSSHKYSWEAFADWQQDSSLPEEPLTPPVIPEVTLSPIPDITRTDTIDSYATTTGNDPYESDVKSSEETAKKVSENVLQIDTKQPTVEKGNYASDMHDGSPIKKVNIGTTLTESPMRVNATVDAPEKKGRKLVATSTKYYAKDAVPKKNTSDSGGLRSVTYNGVHMRVAVADLGSLEDVVPKAKTKKYVVQRGGPHYAIAESPSSPLEAMRPDTSPGTSVFPSESIPLDELVQIDKDSTLVLPELGLPVIKVDSEDPEDPLTEPKDASVNRDLLITDDLSEASSQVLMEDSLSQSGVSMPLQQKVELQEKILISTSKSSSRPSTTNKSRPPSMRQPYRGSSISVPLKGEVKDKYEPLQPRFVADVRNLPPSRGPPEGVSVYRTPAPLENDVGYVCDGGLDKVPNSAVFDPEKSYMKNPPNYFDRKSIPLYYRMTSREKVLSARASSADWDAPWNDMEDGIEEDSDDSDDDSDDDTVMTGTLSTESAVQRVESTLLSSEREIYMGLSDEEKKEFLLRKKAENKRIVEESKKAFKDLAGDDSSSTAHDENSSVDSSEADGQKDDSVSLNRVMKWNKLSDAKSSGLTNSKISELIGSSSKRRGRFTLKAFTKFAKLLNREVLELACPPEIKMDLGEVTHESVDVKIESTKSGTVYVAVLEGKKAPSAEHFSNIEELKIRYEGVAQIVEKPIHERSTIEFNVSGLRSRTMYRVYACAHHNQSSDKSAVRMSDISVQATEQRFRTEDDPPEILELEWGRMDVESRHDELLAARFDLNVQQAAKEAGIQIPTADMLEVWLDGQEESNQEKDGSDEEGSGSEEDDAEESDSEEGAAKKVVGDFAQWWTDGDEVYGYSKARSDFLAAEAAYICRDGETIELCEDDGYLTFAQTEILNDLIKDDDPHALLESEEYTIFRSWLKGGRVISKRLQVAKDEKELKRVGKLREKLLRKEKKELAKKKRLEDEEKRRQEEQESDGEVGEESSPEGDGADIADEKVPTDEKSVSEKPAPTVGTSAAGSVGTAGSNFVDDDDVEEDEEDEEEKEEEEEEEGDPRILRIKERSERLQDRASNVDDAIKMVSNLHMAYKHGESEGLSVKDLETKRGQLRLEAVTVIMAMKKLAELCEARKILPRDLTESMYQEISGASTFVDVPEEHLKAEMPPQATLLTLLGQDKKPIRAWDKASDREQMLELQIACMMVGIAQLAVEVGVCIPNVEDVNLIRGRLLQPHRKTRWDNFSKWYVGNELHENQMRAIPTVARIMFTDWEKKLVKESPAVKEKLEKRAPAAAPSAGVGTGAKQKAAAKGLRKRQTSSNITQFKSGTDEDEVVKRYEDAINQPDGEQLRCEILQSQVDILTKSRNASMTRSLWSPALPGRVTMQFLFPRMGLITPKFQAPVKRFKPFPSVSNETYSIEEVMGWFNMHELKEDDEMMNRGELEGQKHQAYLDWLAKEEERMEQGRRMMVAEDKRSKLLRIHTGTIENDRTTPIGKARYKDFVFGSKLPGAYDHIAEAPTYEEGTGLDNEDEVQDVVEAMAREAEIALQLAKEAKRKLLEDRKRKEEEEKRAQEKLERDIRIEENKDRLKRVREHLENLKVQRRIAAEEEKAEAEGKARQEEFLQILRQEKEEQEAKVRHEEERRQREMVLMHEEDVSHQILRERTRNCLGMEHEDIRGMLMREEKRREEEVKAARVAELEKLYEPYIPFKFDSTKIRNPNMHLIDDHDDEYWLRQDPDIAATYEETSRPSSGKKDYYSHVVNGEVDWRLYVKRDSLLGDDNDMTGMTYDQEKLQRDLELISRKAEAQSGLPIKKPLGSVPVWPRSENDMDVKTPLIWDGPTRSADKAFGKLRKQPRAFTPINSGEQAFAKTPELSEPKEIVMVHTAVSNALSGGGLPRSLVKSFNRTGKSESVSSADNPLVLPPLAMRSASAAQLTTSEERMRFASFAEPLVYRTSAETLEVGSPSRGSLESRSMSRTLSPIRSHERNAATALGREASRGRSADVSGGRAPPSAGNVMRQHELALASLSIMKAKRNRDDKDPAAVVKAIQSEREAVRAFVTSAAMSRDKYYLETCKPGLRTHDSMSANKSIAAYRDELLSKMKPEDLESARNLGMNSDLLAIIADAPVEESVEQAPLETTFGDTVDAMSATDNSQYKGSIGEDVSDEQSVSSQRTASFQVVPAKLPQYKEHNFPPPFYRKPFGVKGASVELQLDSPTRVAHNKATDIFGRNKLRAKTGTLKSLQRDEYAIIQRKSLETTSRNYDLGSDINFQDNHGL